MIEQHGQFRFSVIRRAPEDAGNTNLTDILT
jgi:hypothetical protein